MPSNAYRSGVHSSTHKSFELLPNITLLEQEAGALGLPATFEVLAEVDSTQKRLVGSPATEIPTGFVCVTHHQSAGRGRLERTWETDPGDGLMFSTVLRPADIQATPLVAGVAAAIAVRQHVRNAGLKWPNDIVVMDDAGIHKLGGIVASVHPQDTTAVVVGVGINFLFSAGRPTPEAAALGDYLSQIPTREAVLIEILLQLGRLAQLERADVEREYRDLCLTLGRPVLVSTLGGETVQGTAISASADGLTIALESGERLTFGSADVVHLRNS